MTVVDPTAEAPLVERTKGNIEKMPMAGWNLVPTDFEQAWRIAQMLSHSAFVPKGFVDKPQDCLAAMAYGAEIGLSPLQSLQGIAIINGRPSLYGDSLIGLVRANPSVMRIEEAITGTGDATEAVCAVYRKGPDGSVERTERTFSVADAKRAGLWNKKGYNGVDTPWITYPMRMLQMRARGFAIRDACADILKGLAIVEEQMDAPAEIVNVTPPEETKPQSATDRLKAKIAEKAPEPEQVATVANLTFNAEMPKIDDPRDVPAQDSLLDAQPTDRTRAVEEIAAKYGPEAAEKMSDHTKRKLFALGAKLDLNTKSRRVAFAETKGILISSYGELTEAEAVILCREMNLELNPPEQPVVIPLDGEECAACEAQPGQAHMRSCPEAAES